MFFKRRSPQSSDPDKYNARGNYFFLKGKSNEALKWYKTAEKVAREIHDDNELGKALNNQGNALSAMSKLDEAMLLYQEAERLFKQTDDDEELAKALNNQGSIHFKRGNTQEALRLFKEKERISQSIGNVTGVLESLNNQTAVYNELKDYDKMVPLLQRSIDLYSEQKNFKKDPGCRQLQCRVDRDRKADSKTG